MQLQYAQDSTNLLAEHFAGSLTTDCTMLLDRKLPRQPVNSKLESTGRYLVLADLGVHNAETRVANERRTKLASNLYYLDLAEVKWPVCKVTEKIDARWIFEALRSGDPDGRELIAQTIDGVNALIAKREFRFLDRVFVIIPPSTASRHVLLALLRASAPVRSKLTYWQTYVTKVRDAFDHRGLDSARLLRGLVD